MIANYHTHNVMCGHASGNLEEYVSKSIELGIKELGMSDHLPFPGDGFGMRMKYDDLQEYVAEVGRLKEVYKDKISILLGAEGEYLPEYDKYYERLLSEDGFEYLILGQHFYKKDNFNFINVYAMENTSDYIDYAKSAMEGMKSGYFKYFAHPDLIFVNDFGFDDNAKRAVDIIVNESVKNDYILEINANGFRRGLKDCIEGSRYQYPVNYLWDQVAKTNIRVMVGADCHCLDNIVDYATDMAFEMAGDKKLNLIERF